MTIPPTTPLPALLPFSGAGVFAQFEVNQAAGSFVSLPPPLGLGSSGLWNGMVTRSSVFLTTATNTVSITSNANDLGSIYLIDNTGSPNNVNVRLDQATVSSSARIQSGALVKPFDITNLPANYFLASLAFGRSQSTLLPAQPDLLTSLAKPDFPALLQSPLGSPFMSLQFRAGNPGNAADLLALPRQTLSVSGLSYMIVPLSVPEPGSWALLLAGFGLSGVVMRRAQRQARSARETAAGGC